MSDTKRGKFSSKFGLILAAAGSAVGLGNIWRFPTEAGANGGSAFILLYILCVVLLGLPVMISEFVIGRGSRANAGKAYQVLAPGTSWKWVGLLGVLAGTLILCYYNVVAGWTLNYAVEAATNGFTAMAHSGGPNVFGDYFNSFISNSWRPVIYTVLFMVLTHVVVVRGVSKGIEQFSKILMPGLFVILLILVGCAMSIPGTGEGLRFMFMPDFSKITAAVVLSAMGQAFYSLSLAMGCLTTYASYFRDDTKLGKTALSIAGIDTMVAVLAGMVIFPAVFSVPGLKPDEGPSLIFVALPHVFQLAFGNAAVLSYVFSFAFYALLVLATLTSTISLHEVATAYLQESRKYSRVKAATLVSLFCTLLGVLCALSLGPLKGFTVFGMTIFDLFDYVTAKWMLPIGGMFIAIFAGWKLNKRVVWMQMTNGGLQSFRFLSILIFMLRYIAPLAILLIFLNELGVFSYL